MKQRRVLITGSSRGLGRAIALRLGRDGFAVTVHCRRALAEAETVAREIAATGGLASVMTFDVRDRAEACRLLESDIEKHGAYYGVVCNAGITRDNAFPALSGEDWDDVVDTSLDGFFNVVHPLTM